MIKFICFLPEIYFFFSILLVLFYSVVYSLSSLLKFPNLYKNIVYLSIVILLYTFFLLSNQKGFFHFNINILYKHKGNILLEMFFTLISILILIVTYSYNNKFKLHSFEYIIILLITLGSSFILLNAMHFILIFILLELQNISISILIALHRYSRYSIEASIKYFILSSFSSLLLLFGISIIYGCTGFLSIYDVFLLFNDFEVIDNHLVLINIHLSALFLLIGLLFKMYTAPFHLWVPEIYASTTTNILVYMSTIPLIVMLFLFLKIYFYVLVDVLEFKRILLSIVGFITLFLGSLGALWQTNIKKVLGYSTITMNGFFIYSLTFSNIELLEMSLMYFFVYIITMLLLFILLLNTFFNNNYVINTVYDLFDLYSYNKRLFNLYLLNFFSLSGIPPFIGFLSKLFWLKLFSIEFFIFFFFFIFVFLIVFYNYIRLLKSTSHQSSLNKETFKFLTFNGNIYYIFFMIQYFLIYCILNSDFIMVFIKIILWSTILL